MEQLRKTSQNTIEGLIDQSGFPASITECETDRDFENWAGSDSLACSYDNSTYVKILVTADDYESMLLTHANEYLATHSYDVYKYYDSVGIDKKEFVQTVRAWELDELMEAENPDNDEDIQFVFEDQNGKEVSLEEAM